MKVVTIKHVWDGTIHCHYLCPGCGYVHAFSPKVHAYNGDGNNPTISPSLLHNNPQGHHTCHSYIKNGMIQFLDDCWHTLKGKTVELPQYDESKLDPKWVEILDGDPDPDYKPKKIRKQK